MRPADLENLWPVVWKGGFLFQVILNLFFAMYTHRDYISSTPGFAWRPARDDELLYVGFVIAVAGLLFTGWTFASPRSRPYARAILLPRIALLCVATVALSEIAWAFWHDLGYRRP